MPPRWMIAALRRRIQVEDVARRLRWPRTPTRRVKVGVVWTEAFSRVTVRNYDGCVYEAEPRVRTVRKGSGGADMRDPEPVDRMGESIVRCLSPILLSMGVCVGASPVCAGRGARRGCRPSGPREGRMIPGAVC